MSQRADLVSHRAFPGGLALVLSGILLASGSTNDRAHGSEAADPETWRVFVTGDNCPDYTWGFTEEETRRAFAEIVRAHLDEMTRTDAQSEDDRDRYNMAVTQEALCFVEHYPDREEEMIRRIREGRLFVSPFLCNSLWAFHSVEGCLRTLMPARRLERKTGVRFDAALHIEEPSLPWGMAPILQGSGIRWVSVPFLDYDSTFRELRNPPVFVLEGPDGSKLGVILDAWASLEANYTQGARVLGKPRSLLETWIPHYAGLGDVHPFQAILASGTHGDISPSSGTQARGFAEAVIRHNAAGGRPRIVNATLPMFTRTVDEALGKAPPLRVLRGSFGHSWDLWPLSAMEHVRAMREGEREWLAAEALLAVAGRTDPDIELRTRGVREEAEWCLAMLSDHAWNGTDDRNRRENLALRSHWASTLRRSAADATARAWSLVPRTEQGFLVFNPSSFRRGGLVRIPLEADASISGQVVEEDGSPFLYAAIREVEPFSLSPVVAVPVDEGEEASKAEGNTIESPHYLLSIDPSTGGIARCLHRASGFDAARVVGKRRLFEAIRWDGTEHTLEDVDIRVLAEGPLLARIRVSGRAGDARLQLEFTVYSRWDRVDLDLRVHVPVRSEENRLCLFLPLPGEGAELRIETTGAVERPYRAPRGDLLEGADPRRFAIQGFVDASLPAGPGVTVASLDAFAFRMDLGDPAFEALGNDHNHKECTKDQAGATDFRFRWALRVHAGAYSRSEAFRWSREVANPLLASRGGLRGGIAPTAGLAVDPRRAVATCLKPASYAAQGLVLRIWETAGSADPCPVEVGSARRAFRTDLLERDLEELPVREGRVLLPVRPFGFAGLRVDP